MTSGNNEAASPSTSPARVGSSTVGDFDALAAQVRFVLVAPSHPGNVGAAARAIKTMGFGSLVLVSPRHADVRTQPDAQALASGADDVLANARIVDSLDEALEGVVWSLALSARRREYGPPLLSPRQAAPQAAVALSLALSEMAGGLSAQPEQPAPTEEMFGANTHGPAIALVFGNERTGLENEHVERCTAIAHIPANPVYSSLNLSQAIQVLAYELRLAFLEHTQGAGGAAGAGAAVGSAPASEPLISRPASADDIEGMYGHLQQALVAIDFLDPDNPKKLMSRLRRLFARSGLEREEVNILRGIAKHILASHKRP